MHLGGAELLVGLELVTHNISSFSLERPRRTAKSHPSDMHAMSLQDIRCKEQPDGSAIEQQNENSFPAARDLESRCYSNTFLGKYPRRAQTLAAELKSHRYSLTRTSRSPSPTVV